MPFFSCLKLAVSASIHIIANLRVDGSIDNGSAGKDGSSCNACQEARSGNLSNQSLYVSEQERAPFSTRTVGVQWTGQETCLPSGCRAIFTSVACAARRRGAKLGIDVKAVAEARAPAKITWRSICFQDPGIVREQSETAGHGPPGMDGTAMLTRTHAVIALQAAICPRLANKAGPTRSAATKYAVVSQRDSERWLKTRETLPVHTKCQDLTRAWSRAPVCKLRRG